MELGHVVALTVHEILQVAPHAGLALDVGIADGDDEVDVDQIGHAQNALSAASWMWTSSPVRAQA